MRILPTALRIAVVTLASLSLSGCLFYRLEELRNTTPTGDDFQKELSSLYMDFATEQEKGYDWFHSAYFAEKGLEAAYGKDVPPEDLNDWDLPPEIVPELQLAREELLEILTPQHRHDSPTRTAQAQVYFDCWVLRQSEGTRVDDMIFCRDGLMQLLQSFGAPQMQVSEPPKPKAKHKKAPKVVATPALAPAAENVQKAPENEVISPEKTSKILQKPAQSPEKIAKTPENSAVDTISYAVFFENGTAQLSKPGENVLDEVRKSLKHMNDYVIVLRDGGANAQLTADRAALVKKMLMDSGVKEEQIQSSSSAPTPSAQHRIEIYLNE